MGTDSGIPPLTRRVPGATNWPTPVTRAKPPVLPESLVQRMRGPTDAADAVADAITVPIPVISASVSSDVASPAVEEIPVAAAPPPAEQKTRHQGSAPQTPVRRHHHTAPAQVPIPVISASVSSDVASPAVEETSAQPDRAAKPSRALETPPDRKPVAAAPTPAQQKTRHQGSAPQTPARRRRHAAAALVSALALIAVGSLAFVLSRQTAAATAPDTREAQANLLRAEAALRNHAAAWVADQVSRAAVVSCAQTMCQALEARGFPRGDLRQLNQGGADPLHSDVIVATAAVRSQFVNRLSSVAPAIIASFGSGILRIDVRAIASHGVAAYRSELSADLLARKATAEGLLASQRIVVSAKVRRQLSAGQVDSRLLVTIEGMAARHAIHQLRIVAFGDSGPGAGAASPFRSADLAEADAAAGTAAFAAFVRSMLAFLHVQRAPFLPAHAGTLRLAAGQTVFRIEFTAPSPLGLLGPNGP